jgi:hypothetical protein
VGRVCSTDGEKRNAYKILLGRLEGKRAVGRPRRRLVDYIKMDLGELGWGGMDCIDLDENRNQWRALCEHGKEPSDSINCWEVPE